MNYYTTEGKCASYSGAVSQGVQRSTKQIY